MAGAGVTRGDLLLLIATLAAFGIATSTYLTWQWYEAASASWCDLDAYFSCTRVRESPYAAVSGIPTATVGIVGFGLLLGLAALGLRGTDRLGPWSTDLWLLAFAGLGVALGFALTLVEIFVIQAICVLCVIAFGLGLAVAVAAGVLHRSPSGAAAGDQGFI